MLSFFRMIILLLDPNLPNLASPDGVGQKNDVLVLTDFADYFFSLFFFPIMQKKHPFCRYSYITLI